MAREWNYHGLTTEGNMTPRQLWITGMLSNSHNNYSAVEDVLVNNQRDLENYGFDEDSDIPEPQTLNNVTVPESPIEISDETEAHIHQILQTTEDDQYCIQKYLLVLDLLEHTYQNLELDESS